MISEISFAGQASRTIRKTPAVNVVENWRVRRRATKRGTVSFDYVNPRLSLSSRTRQQRHCEQFIRRNEWYLALKAFGRKLCEEKEVVSFFDEPFLTRFSRNYADLSIQWNVARYAYTEHGNNNEKREKSERVKIRFS